MTFYDNLATLLAGFPNNKNWERIFTNQDPVYAALVQIWMGFGFVVKV